MGWTLRGSNPVGDEIFHTRPDSPWCPPSILYNGYRVSFPRVKRPKRGVDHPPPCSTEVKERVQLYLHSPSGSSWPVPGRTYLRTYLPFISYVSTEVINSCVNDNLSLHIQHATQHNAFHGNAYLYTIFNTCTHL